ncbi:MAG: hypothetical protein MJY72_08035 [Bacteroidales bacterium]|nr:hypothetical protein [Bacteroidales bacterium]
MKRFRIISIALAAVALITAACSQSSKTADANASNITEATVAKTVQEISKNCPNADASLIERGVSQAAALWRESDGTEEEFAEYMKENFKGTAEEKERLLNSLSRALEVFSWTANQTSVELGRPTTLVGIEPTEVDYILSGYSPMAHFSDDMFANKLAFMTILNFPNFSLAEKDELGKNWSRLEWAYARMGDNFTQRVPAEVNALSSEAYADAENYIADYNIMMGHLLTEDGRKLFPEDMSLLSHWNLRDEIKSNYADVPNASEKQEMIYKVMDRIVSQQIPAAVVNNPEYDWAPESNKTDKDGKGVNLPAEGAARYQHIINQFRTMLTVDQYCPTMPNAIRRHFEGELEMSDADLEQMFIRLISSDEIKAVASIIKERLGRELRPYDIWYDGFKSRSTMPEDKLTAQTRKLYPDAVAFQKDMPRQLMNIGFDPKNSQYIADRIVVEPARGSGHAWNCTGRWEPARLRTRIGSDGMDYKGYNIAVHEFGHNVEMVLDLYKIDQYMLYGVPATGFTEAMAFIFQARDLQLLGYGRQQLDDNSTLDIFWGMYEIMGVSLVDMYIWRWLYEHKDATAEELRDAVLEIAKDVWNKYYEPVVGEHDSILLGVYSHMVNAPMYLPSYPIGHLIHYQLEEHLANCKDSKEFAAELERIYVQGRLTPKAWMQGAVGSEVSVDPVLNAVRRIVER